MKAASTTMKTLGRVLAFACALFVQAAVAQWMPSGSAGQSSLPLSNPGKALALAFGARVLVAGQEDKQLSIVDPDAGTVLGQVLLPHEPRSVAITADGARAYVVYGNDKLTAVDVAARAVLATWTLGGELRSLVLTSGEAELAVVDAVPNRLLAVDAATGAVTREIALLHEPREVVSANGGSRLAVGAVNGWLATIDATAFSVLSELKLADEIRSLAWWEAGARVLAVHKRADAVSLVDLAVSQVTATVALDGDPDRAAVAQGSGVGYVGTHDDASVNRLDLAGPALLGRYAVASRVNALVFDPVANVLYGAPRGDGKLLRLDPAAASLISVLQLQKRLRDVSINSNTHEAVAVADKTDEMFIIQLSDRAVRQIALPARPDLVAADSTLNQALIAFRGSGPKLRFADLAANTLFAETVDYDKNLIAVTVDSTRALALAIAEGNKPVLFVDLNTRTRLADGPAEHYRALAIHSGRGVAYLATEERQLKVMDLASRAITATVELGFKANAIAVDEALDKALITSGSENKAQVLDLATLVLGASHTLPSNPGAVALQPDTHVAVVASRESDALSLVDLAAGVATPAFAPIQKAHALAVSKRYNEAVVLSGERDEVAFVQLPNPVPALQALAPVQAPAGSPMLVLTITGTGFVDASRAHFGATALATRWQSATELQADVPANLLATPGDAPVTVQNPAPAGGTSNALTFSVLGPPTLASIAPPSAVADGEPKPLQLTGENFVDGASVLFGTSTLPAIFNSSTSLTVVVPSALTGAAGTVQVSVINPGGLLSNSLPFTLVPALAIHSLAPASGDVGTVVTLSGTGFDPAPAANQLVFRGIDNTTVSAVALTSSATAISVRVPPLADSGPITLTNSRGTVQSPPFTVAREQDFQLVVSPAAVTVHQGASNTVQAQLSSIGTKSFTGLVTLSVQGLPPGVTASFSPAQTLSALQAGAITLAASGAAEPASYNTMVQASFTEGGTAFVRSSPLSLTVASGANVTGLKGRFVTPEGQGIAGVIVRADTAQNPQPQTTTDAAGSFMLAGLPAGQITLRFDATPANPLYPIWPYTTALAANQIAVVPDWTIAPPPADAQFTPIQANSPVDQVITDERYPGMRIVIPAGTTIAGYDGVLKSRIAVQRIDVDKLPVTPPPVPIKEAFQIYFGTPMGGIPSKPIPVSVPNVTGLEPGAQTQIWYFDGSPMGGSGEWKLAGPATISPDGATVTTNPGFGIPRFCGVCGLFAAFCPPPPSGKPPGPEDCKCGNPIDMVSGYEMPTYADLRAGGVVPREIGLSFHPVDGFQGRAGIEGAIGHGWVLDQDIVLADSLSVPQSKRLILPPNRRINFVQQPDGTYSAPGDLKFDGAVLRLTSTSPRTWELAFKDGRKWRFGLTDAVSATASFLIEQVDAQGNATQIERRADRKITRIGDEARAYELSYGANNLVERITDSAERTLRFTYNASRRIETMTDADGRITRYTYVGDDEFPANPVCTQGTDGLRIKTIEYPGKAQPTVNHHGPSRRILRQVSAGGIETRLEYQLTGACVVHTSNPAVRCSGAHCPTVDSWENFQAGWRIHGGEAVATTVVDASGKRSRQFNAGGYSTATVDGAGQSVKLERDARNRIVKRTDALGRVTQMAYDAKGNLTRSIDALGRITDMTYDPVWNKPTSVTRYDEQGQPQTWRYSYDAQKGTLLSSTDPLEQTASYAYTARGQIERITDALNHVTQFDYNEAGDLTKTIDALLNETRFGNDGAGRRISSVDPLGLTTAFAYDRADNVTRITDPLGQHTEQAYDPAGRLQSVTNPRGFAVESYGYDTGDRLTSRTDAKLRQTLYEYDAAGRLERTIDRKGQVTSYAYDAQNRVLSISRPEGETRYSYDAVGRLSESAEPSGTITYAYDAANRLVRETQATGSLTHVVEYGYDALDRRTSRSVQGMPQELTTYGYDRANRLTSIAYRGQTTTFEYDAAGRLITKLLPNGIRQALAWDEASRLLSIDYKKPDESTIETIAYGYDAGSRRVSVTKSIEALPETAFTAVYDEADRMTSLTLTGTGQSFVLSYDDHGNLTSRTETTNASNVTSYTWDSRNRLKEISGAGLTASFEYDALDRRISRTVNGATTRYIYDGQQALAEIVSGEHIGLLTGMDLDEAIARYATQGARVFLTDALNSVLAQTKEDRSVLNYYAYSAYGETQTLGDDEGNAVQYTARENDQTGLYYYRARYYDPVLKRFISEDPSGLNGGVNLLAYVAGDPVSFADPEGLQRARPPRRELGPERHPEAPDPRTLPCLGITCLYERICVRWRCEICPGEFIYFPDQTVMAPPGWSPSNDPKCECIKRGRLRYQ